MTLSDRPWRDFCIGGESGIFDIQATKSGIDKNKLNMDVGNVPYITRSDANNGIQMFVPDDQQKPYSKDDGNVITIGLDTQTVFYQPSAFFTGQNIQVLRNSNINQRTAEFVIPLLKEQLKKFCWGGNGATLTRLSRTRIMLPIDADGKPDYAFMDSYITAIKNEKQQKTVEFISKQLSKLHHEAVPPLFEKSWEMFYIGKIFDKLEPGKSKGFNHLTEDSIGGTSYIGATNRNNGVLALVQPVPSMVQSGNAVGFIKNGNGSAGYAIYKAEDFIATSDVIFGYADWLNQYTGLFLTTCSDMSQFKYSHGYKWTAERLRKSGVMLPVNDDGQPDYAYMEQYMVNLTVKKLQSAMDFYTK